MNIDEIKNQLINDSEFLDAICRHMLTTNVIKNSKKSSTINSCRFIYLTNEAVQRGVDDAFDHLELFKKLLSTPCLREPFYYPLSIIVNYFRPSESSNFSKGFKISDWDKLGTMVLFGFIEERDWKVVFNTKQATIGKKERCLALKYLKDYQDVIVNNLDGLVENIKQHQKGEKVEYVLPIDQDDYHYQTTYRCDNFLKHCSKLSIVDLENIRESLRSS